MRFTWFTYAAAVARSQARFRRAFGNSSFTFEDIKNPNSDLIRTHDANERLWDRMEREDPTPPPRVVREVAHWYFKRKYGRE